MQLSYGDVKAGSHWGSDSQPNPTHYERGEGVAAQPHINTTDKE